jgi:hypothetical protein
LLIFCYRFNFDHRIFFESAEDFRAGLEDKDMFSRYQQAQEYLKKSKETHQAIVVRSATWFVSDEILSFFFLSRSNLPWACISRVWVLLTQHRILVPVVA